MATKVIPLHELRTNLDGYLQECLDSGQSLVVELPEKRLVSIQAIEDDDLVNDLIEHNPAFRELLARSAASPRKPFQPASE